MHEQDPHVIPNRDTLPDPARQQGRAQGLFVAGTAIAAAILALLLVRYQIALLDYREWGDESETIVGAKMMAAGMSLYGEIFNHHGPLTFLIAYLLEVVGDFGIRGHRVPIAILHWVAIASIRFSPLMTGAPLRNIVAGIAATIMVVYLPGVHGHAYVYQSLAGLVLAIVLAQYTLPAIADPGRLTPTRIAAGNLLLGALPFVSIIYLPVAMLLFLASCRREHLPRAAAFATIGAAISVAFLAFTGSLPGYFAYHFYLNFSVLPLYSGFSGGVTLLKNIYFGLTIDLTVFLTVVFVVSALVSLAVRQEASGFPWRPVLVALAFASLLVRGGVEVHRLPYYLACIALVVVFPAFARPPGWQFGLFPSLLLAVGCVKASLLSGHDKQELESNRIPASTEFSRLARAVTTSAEPIIAYTFATHQYIAAGRLPASGHYFYFPWQAKYNEDPRFGIRIDACAQIRATMPKVMYLDKSIVWGHPWESYAGCVQEIADEHYNQIPGRPHYLRKDLSPSDVGVAAPGEAYSLTPGRALDAQSPIELSMTARHRSEAVPLRSVGILFGMHGGKQGGVALLELRGPGQARAAIRFTLDELADAQFRFFDVPPGKYTEATISSAGGKGIATVESRAADGSKATCLVYDYADGRRRFTPGCPT